MEEELLQQNMEEEGTLVQVDDLKPAVKPSYRLYFKGLVTVETTVLLAGFGVAICGEKEDLLFDMKGPIHASMASTLLEAELIALKYGLSKAVSLQIKDISICCDNDQIFELVMGRSIPEQENIPLLMRDVQGIRKYLASSVPVMLTSDQANLAYKLAIEAISSHEIIIDTPAQKETCNICLSNDINAPQMFSVDKCGHMFCLECVKRHIEVKLLEGSLMTCPGYQCKSIITYGCFVNILTPIQKERWEEITKEDSIPVTNRVYCPNPRCSALMSEIELSTSSELRKCCVKCGESFCIYCKVPWHNNMSCDEYKMLHPNLTENDEKLKDLANEKLWRQCRKCRHMIELSDGCVRIICRCGHEFCYRCGADPGGCSHGHGIPLTDDFLLTPCCTCCGILVFFLVIVAIVVGIIIVLVRRFS